MIPDKLLALRRSAGMSQQEVAAAIGVTRQTVGNWELGKGSPALDKATELARREVVLRHPVRNPQLAYPPADLHAHPPFVLFDAAPYGPDHDTSRRIVPSKGPDTGSRRVRNARQEFFTWLLLALLTVPSPEPYVPCP